MDLQEDFEISFLYQSLKDFGEIFIGIRGYQLQLKFTKKNSILLYSARNLAGVEFIVHDDYVELIVFKYGVHIDKLYNSIQATYVEEVNIYKLFEQLCKADPENKYVFGRQFDILENCHGALEDRIWEEVVNEQHR